MEEDTSKQETTGGPAGEPFVPPRRGGSNAKWFAIIGALIIIIAALAVLEFTRAPASTSKLPTPASPPSSIFAGDAYGFLMQTNGQFVNATVWWGDGTTTTYAYNQTQSTVFVATHKYNTPGAVYVYYQINYASSTEYGNATLLPLAVGFPLNPDPNGALGYAAVVKATAQPQAANETLYAPGTGVDMQISYLGEPSNLANMVVQQSVNITTNGKVTYTKYFNYTWDSGSAQYYWKTPGTNEYVNLSSLSKGYNVVNVTTSVAQDINKTNGTYNLSMGLIHSYYTMVLPSFPNGNVRATSVTISKNTFTNAELAPGGYRIMDPQISYDTVTNELMLNTLQQLVGYVGNSTSSFYPMLAAQLPSISNGEINNNYANFTLHNANGVAYTESLVPYQNYTFQVRSNATWQDGTPVTAWDVYYGLVRDLIFAGYPNNPGWIQAQYMLPGNYYGVSNNYYNITNNLTFDNSTNTVTIHFQQAMSPTLVFMLLSASGSFIGDPSFFMQHGENLVFSNAGFKNYSYYELPSHVPQYIRNHVFADGPYMENYVNPGTQVVLSKNPKFAPVAHYPAPSIQNVIIKYVDSFSQSYLLLKSGQAQSGGIPTNSYSLIQHLKDLNLVYTQQFATPSIFWYNFNFNVSSSVTSIDADANMPLSMFSSWNARNAFAYAYNYTFYMDYQVGNALYGINFGTQIAGMIPPGFLYFQNMSVLNQTTLGVPYFSMAKASQFWDTFMSKDGGILGLSWNNVSVGQPVVIYNGKQLTIPIAIYAADPVDLLGASSWATSMAKLGIKVDVVAVQFNQLLAFFDRPNPAAIWILGWAPDYPYPTDYLQPMALPGAGTYPYANSFDPVWANNTSNPLKNTTLAAKLNQMTNDYNTGFFNPSKSQQAFQSMNRELINLTAYVYLFAQNVIQILSTQLNPAPNSVWQTNIMIGGGQDYLYQYFQYK